MEISSLATPGPSNEERVTESWDLLLKQLTTETELVEQKGSSIIPQIKFVDLGKALEEFVKEIRWRGVDVVKGVVMEEEARGYKAEMEERANLLSQPLTYANRMRIWQPGDSAFALGPHINGGSVGRWEPNGYGLGNAYSQIFQGTWEAYDPWEASCRIPAVGGLYQGSGNFLMFRMFKGRLSHSYTGLREGILMVNLLNKLGTGYFLSRLFSDPVATGKGLKEGKEWRLKSVTEMDSALQGANLGNGQELNDTMAHIPKIEPGDFVVWHCDSIHAVDTRHAGKGDSSVIHIGVNPTTESNVKYLLSQRENFLAGHLGPDFPGGKREFEYVRRSTTEFVAEKGREEKLRSMSLAKLKKMDSEKTMGADKMIERANQILGFA
ncbi:hypothetical protein BDZ45DRAFT_795500 [Acephala macrosclerotiorum]|nr:hypothetical protein BDZ45DRAFT_795500 [Acephala macrosclerotiorum]